MKLNNSYVLWVTPDPNIFYESRGPQNYSKGGRLHFWDPWLLQKSKMKKLENRKKRRFLVVIDLLSNLKRGTWLSYPHEVVEGSELGHMWKKNGGTPRSTSERYSLYWVGKIFDINYFTIITFLINDDILEEIWSFSGTQGGLFKLSMGKESWGPGLSNDIWMTSFGSVLAAPVTSQNRFFGKKKKKRLFFGLIRAVLSNPGPV